MYTIHKLEEYNSFDLDKVAFLHTVCFEKSVGGQYFKWKYLDNPAGKAHYFIAKDHEAIVASCVMIPEVFYFFGEKKTIYKCCDLMVHPMHRNRGLSSKLISFANESLRTVTTLSYIMSSQRVTPLFHKNQWLKVDDVTVYFKHKLQLKTKFLLSKKGAPLPDGSVVKPIDSVSELCKKYHFFVNDSLIHIAKDEQYLGWRLRNPHYTYRILGYYEKDILRGYAIYNIGNIGTHYMFNMIDIEVKNNDGAVIKALLNSMEWIAHQTNHTLMMAMANRENVFQPAMKQNGFIYNPFSRGPLKSIDFNIVINDKRDPRLRDRDRWSIYTLHYDDI